MRRGRAHTLPTQQALAQRGARVPRRAGRGESSSARPRRQPAAIARLAGPPGGGLGGLLASSTASIRMAARRRAGVPGCSSKRRHRPGRRPWARGRPPLASSSRRWAFRTPRACADLPSGWPGLRALHARAVRPDDVRNDEDYDELVLARSIPVRSVCEHHLLPFVGVAHRLTAG